MKALHANFTPVEPEFDFIGGYLCLDFANTVGGLPPDSISQERLLSYPHLVAWSRQANLISADEAQVLLHHAEHAQVEAAAVLERAQVFREATYGIFVALTQGSEPTATDLALFNQELEGAMAGAQLAVTPSGFEWAWRKDEGALDQMLAPLARSVATLLTSAERQFVRQCANEDCRWLFVDTTKNHRRQWCRTSGCGNMMRVRKHRERQRSKET